MTTKEIYEAVMAGEIVLSEHPKYVEKVLAHIELLKKLAHSAEQCDVEQYIFEIERYQKLI